MSALSSPQVGRAVVEALVAAGVTDVVISPGSRSAPLALAAAALAERIHVRVDERTAAFLALGLGRGSGRPAAVVCSSGTAVANHLPAVVEADAAGVPLVVVTADRPPEVRGTGANQTIEQVGIFGGFVRAALDLTSGLDGDAGAVAADVRRVVAAATGDRPGPVHLNVPLREPLLDPPTSSPAPDLPDLRRRVQDGPEPPDLRAGARAVLGTRTGVVVVGEGAPPDPGLLAAAEGLGLPVLAEPTSGARLPGTIRCGHWLAAAEGWLADHRPEVVLQLGRPVLSRAVGGLLAGAAEVVTLDPDGRGWDPGGHTTLRVASRLSDWTAAAAASRDGAFLDAWRAADAVAGRVLDEALDAAGAPTELGIARDLAGAVPDGGQLVVASSLPVRHLNEAMRPRDGLRVLGNRGASGIDGFSSTAVGAALGWAGGPTAALAGDLSVVHDLTGLVLGAEEPRPALPLVVIDNGGGGIFHLLPYGTRLDPATFRRLFATPTGLALPAVASTTGHRHTAVEDPGDLRPALADAWASPGITLVEVRTDTPTETARHRAIGAAIAAAVEGMA